MEIPIWSSYLHLSSIHGRQPLWIEIGREKEDERKQFSLPMGPCYCLYWESRKISDFSKSGVYVWGLKWYQCSPFRGDGCKRQKVSLHQPLAILIFPKDQSSDWCWTMRTITKPCVHSGAVRKAAWKVSSETIENWLFNSNTQDTNTTHGRKGSLQ